MGIGFVLPVSWRCLAVHNSFPLLVAVTLVAVLGGLALLLASIGLYGVMSMRSRKAPASWACAWLWALAHPTFWA
jgi:uncharacterized integral membrane protein